MSLASRLLLGHVAHFRSFLISNVNIRHIDVLHIILRRVRNRGTSSTSPIRSSDCNMLDFMNLPDSIRISMYICWFSILQFKIEIVIFFVKTHMKFFKRFRYFIIVFKFFVIIQYINISKIIHHSEITYCLKFIPKST